MLGLPPAAMHQAQQMRDHFDIFDSLKTVPQYAYTADVPLFLKTRQLIEENVPQASKAFALLAAYGSEVVDAKVPSSALKRHPHVVVRTTLRAAWALMEYRKKGHVSGPSLQRMVESLKPCNGIESSRTTSYVTETLARMQIRHC
jgi:hypothetical protein